MWQTEARPWRVSRMGQSEQDSAWEWIELKLVSLAVGTRVYQKELSVPSRAPTPG